MSPSKLTLHIFIFIGLCLNTPSTLDLLVVKIEPQDQFKIELSQQKKLTYCSHRNFSVAPPTNFPAAAVLRLPERRIYLSLKNSEQKIKYFVWKWEHWLGIYTHFQLYFWADLSRPAIKNILFLGRLHKDIIITLNLLGADPSLFFFQRLTSSMNQHISLFSGQPFLTSWGFYFKR